MKIAKAHWVALAVLTVGCADTATDPLAPATEAAPEASAALFFRGTANVTNEADSGPGSLRAAIERANLDRSIRVIRVRRGVDRIDIASTLHYTGSQSLRIEGDNVIVDAAGAPAGSQLRWRHRDRQLIRLPPAVCTGPVRVTRRPGSASDGRFFRPSALVLVDGHVRTR